MPKLPDHNNPTTWLPSYARGLSRVHSMMQVLVDIAKKPATDDSNEKMRIIIQQRERLLKATPDLLLLALSLEDGDPMAQHFLKKALRIYRGLDNG